MGWISLTWVVGIRCVHYIEQKDCTTGLNAGAIWEIPYTKGIQVDSSNTGRTIFAITQCVWACSVALPPWHLTIHAKNAAVPTAAHLELVQYNCNKGRCTVLYLPSKILPFWPRSHLAQFPPPWWDYYLIYYLSTYTVHTAPVQYQYRYMISLNNK